MQIVVWWFFEIIWNFVLGINSNVSPYSSAPEKSEFLKIWPFWKKSEKKVRKNQSEKIGQKKWLIEIGQKE